MQAAFSYCIIRASMDPSFRCCSRSLELWAFTGSSPDASGSELCNRYEDYSRNALAPARLPAHLPDAAQVGDSTATGTRAHRQPVATQETPLGNRAARRYFVQAGLKRLDRSPCEHQSRKIFGKGVWTLEPVRVLDAYAPCNRGAAHHPPRDASGGMMDPLS
jgi:hypothetical protein